MKNLPRVTIPLIYRLVWKDKYKVWGLHKQEFFREFQYKGPDLSFFLSHLQESSQLNQFYSQYLKLQKQYEEFTKNNS